MSAEAELDAHVRHADEDRWLASRFAPVETRRRLIALYAVNHEIAKSADNVREPAIADIRLAWWREALAEVSAGKPARAHPALEGYSVAFGAAPLPVSVLEQIFEARRCDAEARPFATWAELEAYVDGTAGALMRLAFAVCGAADAETFIRDAGRVWGLCGLARAEGFWRERGRTLAPRDHDGPAVAELITRARVAYANARAAAPTIGAEYFPAFGYLAFAPAYLRSVERAGDGSLPLFSRQLRLVAASATGLI